MNIVYENKSEPMEFIQSTRLSSLPHMHKEVEIVYVEEGLSTAHADREYVQIKTGEIFISFPNQVHFYEKTANGKYKVLIVSPKVFFGISELVYSNIPQKSVIVANNELKKLFKSFTKSKSEGNLTACVGYTNLIMSEILSKIDLKPTIKSSDGTLREIMEFCEKHFSEDISLDTVAHGTHLSRCYISHLFGGKLNLSFTDYISILRINTACELLSETDKKIADISGEVGFGTIRSFNRTFHKVMGMTPQNYRNSIS